MNETPKNFDLAEKGKWLVLVLALFIIFESVFIVESLSKDIADRASEPAVVPSSGLAPAASKEKAVIYFSGPEAWATNKEGELKIVLASLGSFNLDGIDLVVEYDPAKLGIIEIVPTESFDTAARKLIQPEKNRVVISLLEISKKEGVSFAGGEEMVLATLKIKPKLSPGESAFVALVGRAAQSGGTQLVEAGTGKQLDFQAENYRLAVK